jgi:hypothetical protein
LVIWQLPFEHSSSFLAKKCVGAGVGKRLLTRKHALGACSAASVVEPCDETGRECSEGVLVPEEADDDDGRRQRRRLDRDINPVIR